MVWRTKRLHPQEARTTAQPTASDAFFRGLIQKVFGHHCKTSNNPLTV